MNNKVSVILLLLITMLVGCIGSEESKLIGAWETNEDCDPLLGERLTLHKEGKVTVTKGEIYTNWEMNSEETVLSLSNPLYGSREYDFTQIEKNIISLIENGLNAQRNCKLTRD